MRNHVLPVIALLLLAGSTIAALPALDYEENFATLDHCDTEYTTAFWDTESGMLRLHPFAVEAVGSYAIPGISYHLVLDGDLLYVAAGSSGLQVIGIEDPTSPSSVSGYNTPGSAYGVALRGDDAYVADGSAGLQIFDISFPGSVSLVGSIDTPGTAWDVEVAGHHAYVADRTAGLHVIDVSDPAAPVIVDTYDTPNNAYGVALYGNTCYVADGSSGLQIFDITDSDDAVWVGSEPLSGYAWDLVAEGGYAYVACDAGGLYILDLSRPTDPAVEAVVATTGPALDAALDGRYLYLSVQNAGVEIYDVIDPASPQLKHAAPTDGSAWATIPCDRYCFVADGSAGLHVLQVRERLPMIIGLGMVDSQPPQDLEARGSRVFGINEVRSILSFDVTDPLVPLLVDSHGGYGEGLDVAGNLAYVAGGNDGIIVKDLSDPTDIVTLDSHYSGEMTFYGAIAAEGDLAALPNLGHGVDLFWIGGGGSGLVLLSTIDTASSAYDVVLDGDVLHVAILDRVASYDVSDPTAPVLLDDYVTGNRFDLLARHGNVLYAVETVGGAYYLDCLDIANPTSISLIDWLGLGSYEPSQLLVKDDMLVIMHDNINATRIYDISIPSDPDPIMTHYQRGFCSALSGDDLIIGGQSRLYTKGLYERTLNLEDNQATSTELTTLPRNVVCASVSATALNDDITLKLLGASGWIEVDAEFTAPSWGFFAEPHPFLKWSAEIDTPCWEYSGDPGLTFLRIWWRYDCSLIESITDVPNDQGRQVSLRWVASGYDRLDSPTPIHEYAIYRWVDPDLRAADGARDGDWHYLMSVPACCETDYAVVAPTLADSTMDGGLYESAFMVRALTDTPGIYFDSPEESGYSVDNLAPSIPGDLSIETGGLLVWQECPDADFDHFTVYGSGSDVLDPSAECIAHTTGTEQDIAGLDWDYFHVTATDFSGNEGEAISTSAPTAGGDDLPLRFSLRGAHPNPFNPTTTILFDLPTPERATVRIFDQAGRLVRVLIDEHLPAGHHRRTWHGRDDAGRRVASGVYLTRLEANGQVAHQQMTLVR